MKAHKWMMVLMGMIFLSACEQLAFEEYEEDDPEAVFEQAWTFADHYYSYFDLKGVDWDSVYNVYGQRVRQDMGSVELFDLLAEMFFLLEDGHVNLRSAFDRSRYWQWYLNAPENFDYSILEREYFMNQQRFIGPFQSFIFDSIGYAYLPSFSSGFSDGQLNILLNSFRNTKGVIIDVRNNGGGSSSSAERLASRFLDQSLEVGRKRYKNGPGDNDFSDWEEVVLHPPENEDAVTYTGPVVVLTNRKSYSATNSFAQYMSEMKNVTLIGDRTGGGAGTPRFTELSNGWILRVSTTQFQNTEGVEIESGVAVDIEVDISEEDEDQNKDTILEYAIDYLKG